MPVFLNTGEDAAAGRIQMPVSATCPKDGALGRCQSEVGAGLPEKEELEPGHCCLGHLAAQLQTRGLPGKASRVLPGHSARRPKEPDLLEAPHRSPLGRRQGCLGLGSVYVCVVVCVHENWHMCTNVAMSGPGAESKRMRRGWLDHSCMEDLLGVEGCGFGSVYSDQHGKSGAIIYQHMQS